MELGITDVTALEPMVLATYPSYTSSQIAKNSSGLWYVIATGTYLNKWVTVDGNYRYYQNGVLQTGFIRSSCLLLMKPVQRFTGSTWVRTETCAPDGFMLVRTMSITI